MNFLSAEDDQRKLFAWVDEARLRAQWRKLLDLCDAQTRADLLKHFIERGLSGHSVSAGDEFVMLNEAHDLMLNRKYRFRPVTLPAHVWWASASLEARGLSTAPSPGGMHAILRVITADHMSLVNSTELHCELHSLLEERDAGSQ